jgi:hypothetical protein
MKRRALLASLTLLGAARARALKEAEPEAAKPGCYGGGDLMDGTTFVLDSERRPVRLLDLVRGDTRILYLVILGGANGEKEPGLWCGDTRSDLVIHAAMLRRFAAKGVRFVAVATPPVYSEARKGYEAGVFLTTAESSAAHAAAVEGFIARTEALRAGGTLPFTEIFYDPRFRLLDNVGRFPHVAAYGAVHAWQGRFKACGDGQRHGTPTLWLLGPDGRVLHEPFYGNVYEPPDEKIRYREADVAGAIEAILTRAKGSEAR